MINNSEDYKNLLFREGEYGGSVRGDLHENYILHFKKNNLYICIMYFSITRVLQRNEEVSECICTAKAFKGLKRFKDVIILLSLGIVQYFICLTKIIYCFIGKCFFPPKY